MLITYAYGALPPTDITQRKWLLNQLLTANNYRNSLIALRKARRERMRSAFRDTSLNEDERDLWIEKTRELYNLLQNDLRKKYVKRGLKWGTYLLIEDEVDRAFKSKGEPKFKRFDSTGRIGATIPTSNNKKQRALESKHCRIHSIEGKHAIATLILGEDISIDIPFVYHRELPEGFLQQVWIQIYRVGTQYKWGLRLVVKLENPKNKRNGEGKVSINMGWRVQKEGIRVATAVDEKGIEDYLIIPHEILESYRHSDQLKSLADRLANDYFGDCRKRTRMRKLGLIHPAPRVPERRTPPWENLRHWALQDRHLYQWECEERNKAIRRRKQIVLKWIQKLAETYNEVTVDAFELEGLIAYDSKSVLIKESRHVRFMVAPGEMRSLVKQEFGMERTSIVEGATTITCHVCKKKNKINRIQVRHICERCGESWDIDVNNSKNQLSAKPKRGENYNRSPNSPQVLVI